MRVGLVTNSGKVENIFEYDCAYIGDTESLVEVLLEECNMLVSREEMIKILNERKQENQESNWAKSPLDKLVHTLFEVKEEISDNTFLDLCSVMEGNKFYEQLLVLTNSICEDINTFKINTYSNGNQSVTYVGNAYKQNTPYKTYLIFETQEELYEAYNKLLSAGYISTDNVKIVVNKCYGITEVYSVKNEKQEEI